VGHDAEDMVLTIERHVRDTRLETGRGALAPRVLEAMRKVPRHRFVPDSQRASAYRDSPLPIGHGQTISQPFIVALMTDLIDPEPGHVVLEVGSGCGYQAAVLAELVKEVWGIEIIVPLALRAQRTLQVLGYANATVRAGDGYAGWPEHAPFDGIVVTAAGSDVPEPLKQQLKIGGRMVLPVELSSGMQELLVVQRESEKDFTTRSVLAVRFVPLVRGDDAGEEAP
jgi:protein-L-isoaspartate(D-aspartate) O-methyltransferase